MPKGFDLTDLNGDEDARLKLSLGHREGTDPRATWEDWGDYDCDHPNGPPQKRDGPRFSTEAEIEEYWNSLRPSGWQPVNPPKENP
jgi:hypothetical protein